jgi:APA family basic amino acid/polyamine antiporter
MVPATVAAAPPHLVRGIRRWDFVALIINITIGAGILGLPAKLYALAGTYSLGAYLTSAAIVTGIILCFAEVSSRFNGAGGPYLYARVAFGPLVGFEALQLVCGLRRLLLASRGRGWRAGRPHGWAGGGAHGT